MGRNGHWFGLSILLGTLSACRGGPDPREPEPRRAELVSGHGDGDPAEVQAHPAERSCELIAAENARVLEAVRTKGREWSAKAGEEYLEPLLLADFPGCRTTGAREGEAWAIAVEAAVVLEQGGPWTGRPQYEYRVVMAFVAASGEVRRAAMSDPVDARPAESGDVKVVPSIETMHDFDGDGRAEAVVAWRAFNGEVGERWVEIYRASGDTSPARWPNAELMITSVLDIDGDGRLDLADDKAFAGNDATGMGSTPTIPAVLHVLEGGRLSANDEAVKSFYRKACGGKKVELGALRDGMEPGPLLREAVCAWLWGTPRSALVARLRELGGEERNYFGPWDELEKAPVTLE